MNLEMSLASTLLWTRLLHLVGAWPVLRSSQEQRINGAYMRPLRRIAGVTFHGGSASMGDTSVLVATGALPVNEVLRFSRLLWLPKLLRKAPSYLLTLLDC